MQDGKPRDAWKIGVEYEKPVVDARTGDAVPYEHRQATLARLLMGTLSGMMAGQLAGGLFADSTYGWRGAFGSVTTPRIWLVGCSRSSTSSRRRWAAG